jgi:Fe-S cluster assembly protein SufD
MAVARKVDPAALARLDELTLPEGGGWLRAAREDAVQRLRVSGLPQRRDEYWKYTDPTSLTAAEPPSAALFEAGEVPLFAGEGPLRAVFVDGRFDADRSDDLTAEGVEIVRLDDAAQADIHWARDLYGRLEAAGQVPVPRPLATLNSALATDGVALRVTGRVARPIALVYLRADEGADAILHHLVKVEEGAEVTLLETGPGAARLNTVLEADIAAGGKLHHVRTQGRDHQRRMNTHVFARLGAESVFKTFTLSVNGRLTRNETVVEFTGDDAVAHLAGAAVGDGEFHHDDTVFVTHDALNCESRQVFKKVLRNGAVGVFQGKILVRQGAQKTDGYQLSQSLLLDDDSQFLAKPELEIYADDVACSHGSTSGAIDDTALFYLRSRGVPDADAKDLLVLAFLAEAIAEIEDADIAADLVARLEAWLRRRRD